jgi:hypothetical protein
MRLLFNFGGFLGIATLWASTAMPVFHESQKFVGQRDVGQKQAERFSVAFLNHN